MHNVWPAQWKGFSASRMLRVSMSGFSLLSKGPLNKSESGQNPVQESGFIYPAHTYIYIITYVFNRQQRHHESEERLMFDHAKCGRRGSRRPRKIRTTTHYIQRLFLWLAELKERQAECSVVTFVRRCCCELVQIPFPMAFALSAMDMV